MAVLVAVIVIGSQGVAMKYIPVYVIFTTKMPRVAEVAAFCDPYYLVSNCKVPW